MSRDMKRSMAAMSAMILLGILVLYTGLKSLFVVIPAAVLVWYAAQPRLRSRRN